MKFNIKRGLKQLFCRHKETQLIRKKQSVFSAISGDRIYVVCKKCKKVTGSFFAEHEGLGYK